MARAHPKGAVIIDDLEVVKQKKKQRKISKIKINRPRQRRFRNQKLPKREKNRKEEEANAKRRKKREDVASWT